MTPATILVFTFAGLAVGLLAFFWGTTLFLQSSLYSVPTSKLAIRSAIAALLVGGFLTVWTFVNTRADSKDRYGTLFEFKATASHEFAEFTAIRQNASKKETPVEFKKLTGKFVEVADTTKQFNLNSADYLVSAIEIKDGDKKVRYDAQLDAGGRYAKGGRIFLEAGGRRYIEFGQSNIPSPIYAPSRAAVFAALGLNFLNFVVWFVALWPVLRYTMGHAMAGAMALGLFVMLLFMPLLFEKNKVPEAFRAPPGVGQK